MANPRKQIILNEILFWKQNKLLPEHYCDFLMTLYLEGNEFEANERFSPTKAVMAKEKRNGKMLTSLIVIIPFISIILLFTLNQITNLLLILTAMFAVASIIGACYYSKTKGIMAPLLHIVSALFIFSISVKVGITFFHGDLNVLFIILITNCLIWIGTGIFSKLVYFTMSGSLGLVVLICYKIFIN